MKRYAPVIICRNRWTGCRGRPVQALLTVLYEQAKEKGDMESVHVRGAADAP